MIQHQKCYSKTLFIFYNCKFHHSRIVVFQNHSAFQFHSWQKIWNNWEAVIVKGVVSFIYISFIQSLFKYHHSYYRRSWHQYKLAWCNYWVSRHLLHRWPKCNIFKFWMDSSASYFGKMIYCDIWYQHSVSSIFESQNMNKGKSVKKKKKGFKL